MLAMILPVAVGALLGAGLGFFGQCSSGTCPLTASWWRGALYGAALGGVFGFGTGRRAPGSNANASAESTNVLHVSSGVSLREGAAHLVGQTGRESSLSSRKFKISARVLDISPFALLIMSAKRAGFMPWTSVPR